jgi:hypothetical protein
MYDQGMIVETEDDRYIVNFKYVIKSQYADLHLVDTGSYEAFDSVCYETMVGVV